MNDKDVFRFLCEPISNLILRDVCNSDSVIRYLCLNPAFSSKTTMYLLKLLLRILLGLVIS